MQKNEIVESVENFYDVWSDGLLGDFEASLEALTSNETYSSQASKKLINNEVRLRKELSREVALSEKAYFENMGLRCKLEHVGPRLLAVYTEREVKKFINDLTGSGECAYLERDKSGVYHIFSAGNEISVDYDEIGYYRYLACIRYLAINGKIKT
jgi:hypothetical protein